MPNVCFLNSGPESFTRATSPAGGPCPPAGEVAKPSSLHPAPSCPALSCLCPVIYCKTFTEASYNQLCSACPIA